VGDISLLIASTTRNERTLARSISYLRTLGQPQSMEFATSDPEGGYYPDAGNDVELQHSSSVKFSGLAYSVERIRKNALSGPFETRVSCVGNNYRLGQRLVEPREWTGKTVLEIVTDLVADYLTGDLTDASLVEAGPTLASFRVEDYIHVDEVLTNLTGETGMVWDVNEENKLRVFTPTSNAAPFSITNSSNNVTRLTIRETLEDYCNKAVGVIDQAIRDPETQLFTGDGSSTTFEVDYPIAEAPTVTVNGVEQTVGVQDVDSGKDWYWSKSSTQIRQNTSPPSPLGVLDELVINYKGLDRQYVFAENSSAIAARALIEGNSGKYEKRLNISGIMARGDAQVIVQAWVDLYSQVQLIASIETTDHNEPQAKNLQVGDLLSITIDGWAGVGDYLVQSIRAQAVGRNDQAPLQFAYAIEAVNGPKRRNYVDFFKGLSSGGGGSVAGGLRPTGGNAVFQETVELSANTTHASAYAPTKNSWLVVRVKQGPGPAVYTINFDADQFVMHNTNISGNPDTWTMFMFCGFEDGKWWQCSTVTDATPL
jgi:hypothetical protein